MDITTQCCHTSLQFLCVHLQFDHRLSQGFFKMRLSAKLLFWKHLNVPVVVSVISGFSFVFSLHLLFIHLLVSLHPDRFTLAPELHPDWMLLLFFTHTHLTVTVALGLLLIPKVKFTSHDKYCTNIWMFLLSHYIYEPIYGTFLSCHPTSSCLLAPKWEMT